MDTVGFLRPFNDPDLPSGILDFCGSKLSWEELCDKMKGNAVTLGNRVGRKILKWLMLGGSLSRVFARKLVCMDGDLPSRSLDFCDSKLSCQGIL